MENAKERQGWAPGMSNAQHVELQKKRQSVLDSKLMDSIFTASDAAKLLSNYREGQQVTRESARDFCLSMVKAGLLSMTMHKKKESFCKPRAERIKGPWLSVNNTIPIGRYYPNE